MFISKAETQNFVPFFLSKVEPDFLSHVVNPIVRYLPYTSYPFVEWGRHFVLKRDHFEFEGLFIFVQGYLHEVCSLQTRLR